MSVLLYHPQTGATVSVTPDAVPHHRQSGWLLASEHAANQAQAAEQAAAAEAAAKKTSSKSEEK